MGDDDEPIEDRESFEESFRRIFSHSGIRGSRAGANLRVPSPPRRSLQDEAATTVESVRKLAGVTRREMRALFACLAPSRWKERLYSFLSYIPGCQFLVPMLRRMLRRMPGGLVPQSLPNAGMTLVPAEQAAAGLVALARVGTLVNVADFNVIDFGGFSNVVASSDLDTDRGYFVSGGSPLHEANKDGSRETCHEIAERQVAEAKLPKIRKIRFRKKG